VQKKRKTNIFER